MASKTGILAGCAVVARRVDKAIGTPAKTFGIQPDLEVTLRVALVARSWVTLVAGHARVLAVEIHKNASSHLVKSKVVTGFGFDLEAVCDDVLRRVHKALEFKLDYAWVAALESYGVCDCNCSSLNVHFASQLRVVSAGKSSAVEGVIQEGDLRRWCNRNDHVLCEVLRVETQCVVGCNVLSEVRRQSACLRWVNFATLSVGDSKLLNKR